MSGWSRVSDEITVTRKKVLLYILNRKIILGVGKENMKSVWYLEGPDTHTGFNVRTLRVYFTNL